MGALSGRLPPPKPSGWRVPQPVSLREELPSEMYCPIIRPGKAIVVLLAVPLFMLGVDAGMQRPEWLSPFLDEFATRITGDAQHLHISYDAHISSAVVLGGYETELRKGRAVGVTYTEGNDGADTIVRASRDQTVCSIRIRPIFHNAHVEIDCVLN